MKQLDSNLAAIKNATGSVSSRTATSSVFEPRLGIIIASVRDTCTCGKKIQGIARVRLTEEKWMRNHNTAGTSRIIVPTNQSIIYAGKDPSQQTSNPTQELQLRSYMAMQQS